MNAPSDDPLADARLAGRREAQLLDLRLRQREAREREDRLGRLVAERSDLSMAPATRGSIVDSVRIERLERELSEVTSYQSAILRSKGWKMVQSVRRLFGRAW